MMISQRFKENLIKNKLIGTLIEAVSILPPQTKLHDDMFI